MVAVEPAIGVGLADLLRDTRHLVARAARSGSTGECAANASLIALAPDMARLLVDAMAELDAHVADCEDCGGNGWDYARDADGERRVGCHECGWARALLARFAELEQRAAP